MMQEMRSPVKSKPVVKWLRIGYIVSIKTILGYDLSMVSHKELYAYSTNHKTPWLVLPNTLSQGIFFHCLTPNLTPKTIDMGLH
jgi:hypothetical protein